MTISRNPDQRRRQICLAAAAAATLPARALAQDKYPSRPVEIIVPWGPGGGADVLGRLVAKWFERELKVPFPVINAPGATGTMGIHRMVQQGADAHTIAVMTGDSLPLAAISNPQLKANEITALGIMIRQPSGLFAKADGPFKSWEDVVAAAKAKPGTISVAITGANSPDELTVNYLGTKGVSMVNVGYTKPGERYAAVIGGHVNLLYEQAGDVKGQLESKALRPLIFFAAKRLPAPFADVPVSADFGYDILLPQMRAIIAHAGAAPDRLATLAASLDRFAATPEFQAYLRDQYALPDSYLPRREAQRFLDGEVDAFRKLFAGK
jgi:tripartite-type tricarboxylate transporter receptor subunit TctC